jgi:hypothetical protein
MKFLEKIFYTVLAFAMLNTALAQGQFFDAVRLTQFTGNAVEGSPATYTNGILIRSMKTVDYDNDGDMDLAICATNRDTNVEFAKLYINNSTPGNLVLTESSVVFADAKTMLDWMDVDRNGLQDLLVADADKNLSIYMNKGGGLFEKEDIFAYDPSANFTSRIGDATGVSWADYDADGDLDMMVRPTFGQSVIYSRQTDGSFVKSSTPGCLDCIFTDYDGDGDYDATDGKSLYTNINNEFSLTHNLVVPNMGQSFNNFSAVSHDFTGDGKTDLLIQYKDTSPGAPQSQRNVRFFRNDDSQFTSLPSFSSGLFKDITPPLDFDHNGKLDVLYFGASDNPYMNSYFYVMAETYGTEFKSTDSFGESSVTTTAWAVADFDKDGKVDFITAGTGYFLPYYPGDGVFAYFFRNKTATVNAPPSVPTQLKHTLQGNNVVLSWDKSTDAITTQNGIEYNYYLRQGGDTIASVQSTRSGKLKTWRRGNAGFLNSFRFNNLPNGTYQWSVQAIDHSNRASAFATEQTFRIQSSNYPVFSNGGATQQALWNEATQQYVMTYLQSGKIAIRLLDSDAQLVNERITTQTGSLFKTLWRKNGGELVLFYKEGASIWMQRINATTLADIDTRTLLVTTTDLDIGTFTVAYNTKNDEFAALFVSSREGSSFYPIFTLQGKLARSVGGKLQAEAATPVYETEVGANPQLHFLESVNLVYNETYNVYTAAWINRENINGPFANYGTNKYRLLNASLTAIGNPIANTVGYPTNLKLEGGFDNAMMSTWEGQVIVQQTNSNVIPAAKLFITGPVETPVLNLTSVPGSMNFVRQGFTQKSGYEPQVVFNKTRNEFVFAWRSGYDDFSSVRIQRFDVVDNAKLLIDEAIISARPNMTQIVHNPLKNNFLILFNGNQYSLFENQKFAPPVVSTASKTKAFSGDKITITGSNFSKTPKLNTVKFGEFYAEVLDTYKDGKQLEVIVPFGLVRDTVRISVTFDGQVGISNFKFENLTIARITGIDLSQGDRGDVVTITGEQLADNPANFTITFGGVAAKSSEILSSSTEQIKVKIPEAAPRGIVPVVITIQRIDVTVIDNFHIFVTPDIVSIDVPDGLVSCRRITLQGKDFSTRPEDIAVKFGDVQALPSDIISSSINGITVKVPIGAQGTGDITVTIDGRTGTYELNQTSRMRLGSEIQASSPVPPAQITLSNRKDDDVNLEVRVLNQCSVKEVKRWTKGISQDNTGWRSVSLSMENNTSYSILGEKDFSDPVGVNVYFEMHDLSEKKVYSDTFFIRKNFTEFDSANHIPALSFGGDAANYNIVSIPYQLVPNNIPTVFKDLFNVYGYDSAKWRIFHYRNDTERTGYAEYQKGLNTIEAGKGYWMIMRYPQEIYFEGAQSVDLSNGPFEITLQPGWNQIGNPYNFNLSWSDVLAFNKNPGDIETPKTFKDGAFQQGTTIDRFRGAFVKYNGTQPLKLRIPYQQNASINGGRVAAHRKGRDIEGVSWYTPLVLGSPALSNELAGFGMHPLASDTRDVYDESCLPKFANQFDVAFTENLSSSLVSTQDTYQWDFIVRNTTGEQDLFLQWDNTAFDKTIESVYLYDKQQERIINMRQVQRYRFQYPQSKPFAVYAGSEASVRAALQPEQTVLGKAYPNPFAETVNIPFTVVADNSEVTLSLYTLQGQPLTMIAHDLYAPGFYEKSWDGRDKQGIPVSAGTYLYELKVNGNVQYGKVVKK